MAITHSAAARNAATNAVVDLLDGAGSKLVFRISTSSIGAPGDAVATLTRATPAFGASGASVAGRADAGTITKDSSATGNANPVAYASLQTSADTLVIHFAVSGDGLTFGGSTTVNAGDEVSCSALTYMALPA